MIALVWCRVLLAKVEKQSVRSAGKLLQKEVS